MLKTCLDLNKEANRRKQKEKVAFLWGGKNDF